MKESTGLPKLSVNKTTVEILNIVLGTAVADRRMGPFTQQKAVELTSKTHAATL